MRSFIAAPIFFLLQLALYKCVSAIYRFQSIDQSIGYVRLFQVKTHSNRDSRRQTDRQT